MKLIDIKNNSRKAITIQLSNREKGLTPALATIRLSRSKVELDKVKGERRRKEYVFVPAPAVRIGAGETFEGLPECALLTAQLKALTAKHPGKRPTVSVVKGPYVVAPEAKPRAAVKAKPAKTSAKKSPKKSSK